MTTTDAVQTNGPSESGEGRAWPVLPLKLKDYFHPDCGDAYYFGWAASRLHVGIRIENMADHDGNMCLEVTLYDDVPLIDCGDTEGWWPLPRGWAARSHSPIDSDDLWDALSDSRWETLQGRAYMLNVRHLPGCCWVSRAGHSVTRQEWFVDFSKLELNGDLDYQSFPHPEIASSSRP